MNSLRQEEVGQGRSYSLVATFATAEEGKYWCSDAVLLDNGVDDTVCGNTGGGDAEWLHCDIESFLVVAVKTRIDY